MIHEKLKSLRKQKGMNQEEMANILSTDISSYCRKENGKSKIHDDEWEKLARALDVSVDDIKDIEKRAVIYKDNLVFNDTLENNRNQNIIVTNAVLEDLQDYICLLKQENESLKKELKNFRLNNNKAS